MSIKNKIKDIFCINTYFNNWIYNTFSSNESEMEKVLNVLGSLDTINDVSELQEYRRAISEENKCFYTTNANISNARIYGIWKSLFGNVPKDPRVFCTPAVEHGLIFSKQIFTDVRFTCRASVATFGDFRKKVIHSYKDLPVFCVGPYIQYAEHYYDSDKRRIEKQKLGKTLVVFPAHGTNDSRVSSRQEKYIEQVNEVAKSFNSVLVNAYWWNINDPIISAFEAEGYRIVSAGVRDDVLFLSRLKTILSFADLVVGDSIGTHVGYCLSMNIPFRFVDADTKYEEISHASYLSENEAHQNELAPLFLNSNSITSEQIKACEPYWGLNQHFSNDEMAAICSITQRIVDESAGYSFLYGYTARKLLDSGELNEEQKNLLRNSLS